MHLNLLAITIKKQELLELGLNLKYMILPINMELVPLSLEISNNVATIILGVKIHSFIYAKYTILKMYPWHGFFVSNRKIVIFLKKIYFKQINF